MYVCVLYMKEKVCEETYLHSNALFLYVYHDFIQSYTLHLIGITYNNDLPNINFNKTNFHAFINYMSSIFRRIKKLISFVVAFLISCYNFERQKQIKVN